MFTLHPAKVGRKAYNPVFMLKILIIQQIYGHSDPEMELMLKGNLFYRRFLGLSAVDPVPDYSTISRFRTDLKSMNLYRKCFNELKRQLAQKGFELRAGKIIDARLVKAARKPGKDDDASFTKKGKKTVYGYKDHIAVDPKNEFVSEFVCTPPMSTILKSLTNSLKVMKRPFSPTRHTTSKNSERDAARKRDFAVFWLKLAEVYLFRQDRRG